MPLPKRTNKKKNGRPNTLGLEKLMDGRPEAVGDHARNSEEGEMEGAERPNLALPEGNEEVMRPPPVEPKINDPAADEMEVDPAADEMEVDPTADEMEVDPESDQPNEMTPESDQPNEMTPGGQPNEMTPGGQPNEMTPESPVEKSEPKLPDPLGCTVPIAMEVDKSDDDDVEDLMETDPSRLDDCEEFYQRDRDALLSYAREFNTSQIYARKRNYDEFYIYDEDDEPVYAKKINAEYGWVPFYARNTQTQNIIPPKHPTDDLYPFNEDGTPIFPKENGGELYLFDKDGNQVYPRNRDRTKMFYAKNADNRQMLAMNNLRKPFYAQMVDENNEVVEYLPKFADLSYYYITEHYEGVSEIRYPFNLSKKVPIYPTIAGKQCYEMDSESNEIYARRIDHKQIPMTDPLTQLPILAKNKDGKPMYPKLANGDEYYPKDENRNEYYVRYQDEDMGARRKIGGYRYAKTNRGREFYPRVYY